MLFQGPIQSQMFIIQVGKQMFSIIKIDNKPVCDMNLSEDSYRNFKCGIASFFANYVAGILHPFDVIKTRFQSHDGKGSHDNIVPKYKGIYHAFKQIYINEGLKGLFKGFYMSLLSQAIASSLFFWLYQSRKSAYLKGDWQIMHSVAIASLEAGVIASILTQPFWVIKTRMLLNIDPHASQLSNFYDKSREIYKQYGLRGYMKGLSLNIWLSALGISQMFFYEGSKILYGYLNIPESKFAQKNFICGGLSKILSGLIMYPLTTVRTRIQQNQFIHSLTQQKYKGNWDIISRTAKEEGLRGFYKGIWANILKGIPQKGIYFYFYQLIKLRIFDIVEVKKY